MMTREEVIKELWWIKEGTILSRDGYGALEIAISVLEGKSDGVDDSISRQAAIDIVRKWFKKVGINGDICLDGLRQLPSAQPEPKWIPCSERLPEVNQLVLCQCRARIVDALWLSEGKRWENYYVSYLSSFVIAWMPLPLPEPYREEGE